MKTIFILQALLSFILITLINRWVLSQQKEAISQNKTEIAFFILLMNLGLVISMINPINTVIKLSEFSSLEFGLNIKTITKVSLMSGLAVLQIICAFLMAFISSYSLFRLNFVKSKSQVIQGVGWVLFLTFSVLCHLLFQNLPSEFLVTPNDINFN